MFCRQCGTERPHGDFCPSCGFRNEPPQLSGKLQPPPLLGRYPNPVQRVQRPTNSFAIASLLLSLTCCGGVLAIVFGHVALSQIKSSGEEGRGLAIAGLVLGYIGLALTIVYVIIYMAIGVGTDILGY